MCADLESFRKRSQFSDVVLCTADGGEFPAHKVILSARSSVFEAMFSHDQFVENKSNRVEIEDISKEVMEALLKYIYSGDIAQVKQYAVELLEAADKVCIAKSHPFQEHH